MAAEALLSAAQAALGQEISTKVNMSEPLDQRIHHAKEAFAGGCAHTIAIECHDFHKSRGYRKKP